MYLAGGKASTIGPGSGGSFTPTYPGQLLILSRISSRVRESLSAVQLLTDSLIREYDATLLLDIVHPVK